MSDDDYGRSEPEVTYLDSPEIMKKEILPKLDYKNAFGEIYQNIWHASNDMDDNWTEEKDPYEAKGLNIGSYPFVFEAWIGNRLIETDDPQRYSGPILPDSAYDSAYVLDSGMMAKVTNTREPYDTHKSLSCYGEWGTLEKNKVSIVNDISGLTRTRIEELIERKIKRNEDIQKVLQEKKVNFGPYQWECAHNGLYDEIRSADGLQKRLEKGDVNEKIFINSNIIPLVAGVLCIGEKIELARILNIHFNDQRMCRIPSAGASYADEEDTRTVSSSAKYALGELKIK